MIDRMRNWWAGLSRREHWLVGVAAALALTVLVWALARPAYAALVDLGSDHAAAKLICPLSASASAAAARLEG